MVTEIQIAQQAASILAGGTSPERFAALAWQAIRRNPGLSECSQESLLSACMDAARLGLDPDGKLCSILPRSKRGVKVACCDIGYLGYLSLASRAGITIHADVVLDGDDFEWGYTSGGLDYRHKYGWNRGTKRLGAYAVAWKDGRIIAGERMTAAEVEECRRASRSPDGIWTGPFAGEMWKKTPVRRLAKKLDLSPEFRDVERTQNDDDAAERPKIEVSASPALPDYRAEAVAVFAKEHGEEAEAIFEQVFGDLQPTATAARVAQVACLMAKGREFDAGIVERVQNFVSRAGFACYQEADNATLRTLISKLRTLVYDRAQ